MSKAEEFVAAWNTATSVNEFLELYPHPITREAATVQASRLRKKGYELQRFRRKPGEGIEEFVAAWNAAESIDDFLKKSPGSSRRAASSRASQLRLAGYKLKKFGSGQQAAKKRPAKRIAAIRAAQKVGLSIAQIAQIAGVSRQTIHNWIGFEDRCAVCGESDIKIAGACQHCGRPICEACRPNWHLPPDGSKYICGDCYAARP